MTTLFCPDCNDEVPVIIDDCSFDHEFGVEWIFDYHCAECERLLHTRRSKPKPEFNEPY